MPGDPIGLDELKAFLWSAATRLRGQIDAAGYKEYIFPLLFFKRISDVYDEQFDGFLHDGGVEYANMQAEELAIRIPDGAHWKDVRQVTENVGQRLVEAFIAIEQANPGEEVDGRIVGGLDGIFGPKDGWTNKAKMPDHIITSLIEDFSKYNLSLAACPADEMGQAYEYLVGKFADDAGNTAQEFYTNRTVVTLMAEILQPKPNESIYDPTCGSGGMLVKCLDYLRQKGQPWQGVKVFGQEINALTSAIARMNLYLNGVEDFSIYRDDTLSKPGFVDGSRLRKFDIVLANPTYSIKAWNREAFMNDKWGRNIWGTPIQARADYAFIQHIYCSMDDNTGRCAILLPHGVLNRDEDKELRRNHVVTDTIEAVIGLGRNLFYNSGLESFIFIFNNNKKPQYKGKVLFIEAEECTHKEGKQSYLYEDDIKKIMTAYRSPEDVPGFSKYVTIDDILANDASLNIKSYVKPIEEHYEGTIESTYKDLCHSSTNLHKAYNSLGFCGDTDTMLSEISHIPSIDKSTWRKVKLGDIASEYSERVDNPSESEYDYYIGSDCIGRFDFKIHRKDSSKSVTSAQKVFHAGDYLMVRRSLYGSDFRERAPRADFDGTCSADILTIRENPEFVDDGFLIYVLYSKELWDFVVANSTGGLTRRIKWRQLQDFELLLPPKYIQKVISGRLWAAYKLKECYNSLLSSTDEFVKSQFIEMFGAEDILHARWPLFRMDEVFSISSSRRILKSEWKDQGTIPFIRVRDMVQLANKEPLTNEFFVSEDFYNSRPEEEKVKPGDIIVSATSTVGKTYIIKPGERFYFKDADVLLFRKVKEINEVFFTYGLSMPTLWNQIKSGLGGTTVAHFLISNACKLMQPLPPLELQEQFCVILEQADKSKSINFS